MQPNRVTVARELRQLTIGAGLAIPALAALLLLVDGEIGSAVVAH